MSGMQEQFRASIADVFAVPGGVVGNRSCIADVFAVPGGKSQTGSKQGQVEGLAVVADQELAARQGLGQSIEKGGLGVQARKQILAQDQGVSLQAAETAGEDPGPGPARQAAGLGVQQAPTRRFADQVAAQGAGRQAGEGRQAGPNGHGTLGPGQGDKTLHQQDPGGDPGAGEGKRQCRLCSRPWRSSEHENARRIPGCMPQWSDTLAIGRTRAPRTWPQSRQSFGQGGH
jgi:hypothetical protein